MLGLLVPHIPNLLSPSAVLPFCAALVGIGLLLGAVGLWGHTRQSRADLIRPGMFGVSGAFGAGKSYFMAKCAYDAQRAVWRGRCACGTGCPVGVPRPVFANFELRGAVELSDWREVVGVPCGSLILMDEAHLWWSSRHFDVPADVESFLTQLRKRGVTFVWATQDPRSVSSRLKGLTYGGVWEGRAWKRGHQYTLYQVQFAEQQRRPNRPYESRVYLVRKRKIMALYDTLGIVKSSREWGGAGAAPERTGGAHGRRTGPAHLRAVD